jgi:hypothetical protein
MKGEIKAFLKMYAAREIQLIVNYKQRNKNGD